jgi:hypothetical protein
MPEVNLSCNARLHAAVTGRRVPYYRHCARRAAGELQSLGVMEGLLYRLQKAS